MQIVSAPDSPAVSPIATLDERPLSKHASLDVMRSGLPHGAQIPYGSDRVHPAVVIPTALQIRPVRHLPCFDSALNIQLNQNGQSLEGIMYVVRCKYAASIMHPPLQR
jgi:hypothetical protein